MIDFKIEIAVPSPAHAWKLFQTADFSKREPFVRLDEKKYGQALQTSWRVASVFSDNKLIGMGRLISDGFVYAALYDVITHPDYQNQGVASHVVSNLEKECIEAGLLKLMLFSNFGSQIFTSGEALSKDLRMPPVWKSFCSA